jgi:hydroxysqualene synthase
MGVDHYENFPVASVLCPPSLRPAVVAIYRFARTADDLADEGTAGSAERLAALAEYRADLAAAAAGRPGGARWSGVFSALSTQIERHALPVPLLHRLLDAFEHDATNPLHADRASLLRYCHDSANPIGRLLLHLYGIDDAAALRRADAICSALQLVNFWQDVGADAAKGRFYLPQEEMARAGITLDDVRAGRDSAALRALIADLCRWAGTLMQEGAPLVFVLPGRAGWELRFVVQGGLRVLEKIRAMDHATLLRRPKLGATDMAPIAWRALRMRR